MSSLHPPEISFSQEKGNHWVWCSLPQTCHVMSCHVPTLPERKKEKKKKPASKPWSFLDSWYRYGRFALKSISHPCHPILRVIFSDPNFCSHHLSLCSFNSGTSFLLEGVGFPRSQHLVLKSQNPRTRRTLVELD